MDYDSDRNTRKIAEVLVRKVPDDQQVRASLKPLVCLLSSESADELNLFSSWFSFLRSFYLPKYQDIKSFLTIDFSHPHLIMQPAEFAL